MKYHPRPAAVFTLAALMPALGAAAQDEPPQSVSLAEAFFIQRNGHTGGVEVFGSLLIWVLIAASAVSIALIVLRWRENTRDEIHSESAVDDCAGLLREGALDRAVQRARQDHSDLGTMLAAALTELPAGTEHALRALDQSADDLAAGRLRRIEPLNIIGGVAPMLGLFGTVYGMILAFREIVAAGGAPDPVGLAAGIGTALTTTFWGLVVAIPALIGFGVLRNAIDSHIAGAESAAEDLISQYDPGPKP